MMCEYEQLVENYCDHPDLSDHDDDADADAALAILQTLIKD